MPRTSITVQSLAAFGGKDEDITYTSADAANNMDFTHPGNRDVFVIVKNKHSSPQTAVVNGVASNKTFQRASDITITTAAGDSADKESLMAVPVEGFTQTDGVVQIDIADDTALSLAVFQISPTPL